MRLIALPALALIALAGCNKTDRANVGNAISNAGHTTVNAVESGAKSVENFASDTGDAIEHGGRGSANSTQTGNASGNKTTR
jgi:hypothetical protein